MSGVASVRLLTAHSTKGLYRLSVKTTAFEGLGTVLKTPTSQALFFEVSERQMLLLHSSHANELYNFFFFFLAANAREDKLVPSLCELFTSWPISLLQMAESSAKED